MAINLHLCTSVFIIFVCTMTQYYNDVKLLGVSDPNMYFSRTPPSPPIRPLAQLMTDLCFTSKLKQTSNFGK